MSERTPENLVPEQDISEVRKVRLAKLAALEEAGRDPFALTHLRAHRHGGRHPRRLRRIRRQRACPSRAGSCPSASWARRVSGTSRTATGELQLLFQPRRHGRRRTIRSSRSWTSATSSASGAPSSRPRRGEVTVHVAELHPAREVPAPPAREVSRAEGSGAALPPALWSTSSPTPA